VTTVAILDYGVGNLHSLAKALQVAGATVRVERDPSAATRFDALVLPGVGAFAQAAAHLASAREQVRGAILDGLPTLGVCLGMQLLFDVSEEGSELAKGAGEEPRGLGVISGPVRRLTGRRVPQIGWNTVSTVPLASQAGTGFPGIAYFANSYVCHPEDAGVIAAHATHEHERFAAAVIVARTVGVQFHPEKSSAEGVRFVASFVRGAAVR